MNSIYHILERTAHAKRGVLATVIKVEGSAYRKEGTSMLFTNGKQYGTLSAGCLETDLAIRTKELLKSHASSCTVVYDMSSEDDLGWGRGAGCNGRVHILLEKVDQQLKRCIHQTINYLSDGKEVNIVRVFNDERAVKDIFVLIEDEQDKSEKDISFTTHSLSIDDEKSTTNTFIQYLKPQERLIIFGAGPDVPPLVEMAHLVGMSVVVWDWRSQYNGQIKLGDLSDVEFIHGRSIQMFLQCVNIRPCDSVVIMTHDFMKDQDIVTKLLEQGPLHYLGILGPRQRTKRLLKGATIPYYIRSPVGLSIGSEGPEEIAISILAEIIKNNRTKAQQKEPIVEQRKDHRNISRSG